MKACFRGAWAGWQRLGCSGPERSSPGRVAGAPAAGRRGDLRLLDVGPTILRLFGLPAPADARGRPMDLNRLGGGLEMPPPDLQ